MEAQVIVHFTQIYRTCYIVHWGQGNFQHFPDYWIFYDQSNQWFAIYRKGNSNCSFQTRRSEKCSPCMYKVVENENTQYSKLYRRIWLSLVKTDTVECNYFIWNKFHTLSPIQLLDYLSPSWIVGDHHGTEVTRTSDSLPVFEQESQSLVHWKQQTDEGDFTYLHWRWQWTYPSKPLHSPGGSSLGLLLLLPGSSLQLCTLTHICRFWPPHMLKSHPPGLPLPVLLEWFLRHYIF